MRFNSQPRLTVKAAGMSCLMVAVTLCGSPVLLAAPQIADADQAAAVQAGIEKVELQKAETAQADVEQMPLSDSTATAIKQVIQTLKRAALDNEPKIRATAISTLASFASYDPEIVDILCAAVDSADPRIKLAGVQAVLSCEETSGKIIDALLALVADEQLDAETRDSAGARLAAIGAEAVVPRAMDALLNGSARQKSLAIQVLASFGNDAQPAIEVLLRTGMNAEEEVSLRTVALSSAGQIMQSVAEVEKKDRQLEARAINRAKKDIAKMDLDGDGKVATDGTELNVAMGAMLAFDEDKDGFITVDELSRYYVKLFRDAESRESYSSTSYGAAHGTAYPSGQAYDASGGPGDIPPPPGDKERP